MRYIIVKRGKLEGGHTMELNTKTETRLTNNRIEYFDFLRIFATVAVIVIHVAAQNWDKIGVNTFQWQLFNIWNSLVRWSVPVFVMISGTLFLGGTQSIKKLFTKYICRIVAAFAFWSVLYAGVEILDHGLGIKETLLSILYGHYHLWFLYMIAGLYLIVPVLRPLVQSEALIKYFLGLTFLFSCVIPQIADCLGLVSDSLQGIVEELNDMLHAGNTMEYGFYFVFGYYLHKTELNAQKRRITYLLGIAGAVVTVGLTAAVSLYKNTPIGVFYNYSGINVVCMAAAVFVWAKHHLSYSGMNENLVVLIKKLSKYSFGAYLVHVLILEQSRSLFGMHTLWINPLISVPIIVVVCAAGSFLLSSILNRIPFLNKYIV